MTAALLPAVPHLFTLGSPLPLFTLKLLAALLEARPSWASTLARYDDHETCVVRPSSFSEPAALLAETADGLFMHQGLVPCFVESLEVNNENNNVQQYPNCLLLVHAPLLEDGAGNSLRFRRSRTRTPICGTYQARF